MAEIIDMLPSRTEQHNGDASQRIWTPNHDRIGLAGEIAFAEFCGLWPDTSLRRSGDGGIDFTIGLRFTVDVKTSTSGALLIHGKDKPLADIYALAKYEQNRDRAFLIGWQKGSVLKGADVHDFGDRGVPAHFIPAANLKPMESLKQRLIKIT